MTAHIVLLCMKALWVKQSLFESKGSDLAKYSSITENHQFKNAFYTLEHHNVICPRRMLTLTMIMSRWPAPLCTDLLKSRQ